MHVPATFEEGFAQAALILMLRAGLIDPADVGALADEYDLLSEREGLAQRQEVLDSIALNLRLIAADFAPPPKVDPEVEFIAAFRRRQMREQTERLNRPDGGNEAG